VGESKIFSMTQPPGEHLYGSEQSVLQNLSGSAQWLTPELREGMVRFVAKYEYARTVEDVLARRSRMLFLNARQAIAVAPAVAEILRSETGCETKLENFLELASRYILLLI